MAESESAPEYVARREREIRVLGDRVLEFWKLRGMLLDDCAELENEIDYILENGFTPSTRSLFEGRTLGSKTPALMLAIRHHQAHPDPSAYERQLKQVTAFRNFLAHSSVQKLDLSAEGFRLLVEPPATGVRIPTRKGLHSGWLAEDLPEKKDDEPVMATVDLESLVAFAIDLGALLSQTKEVGGVIDGSVEEAAREAEAEYWQMREAEDPS